MIALYLKNVSKTIVLMIAELIKTAINVNLQTLVGIITLRDVDLF